MLLGKNMNIIKSVLVALGAFVGLMIVGVLIGGFMARGPAYALGRMGAPMDIILAIVVFFHSKKKFDQKKKAVNAQPLDDRA
jgi:hypothetical protein